MKEKDFTKEINKIYIKNSFRIIFISGVLISLAIISTAFLGYINTQKSFIKKLQNQDIVCAVKLMISKIDNRISRAMETSEIFARDPLNIQWLNNGEKDDNTKKIIFTRMDDTIKYYDYNYFFIAGIKAQHYYFKQNTNSMSKNFISLSKTNPDDAWFYNMLKSNKRIALNVNYDGVLNKSFLFIDVLMGKMKDPVGITGVALEVQKLTKELNEAKVGKNSNLWIIDDKGTIQIAADKKYLGKSVKTLLPNNVLKQIKSQPASSKDNIKVSEYSDRKSGVMDYAYCKFNFGNWTLFYRIDRNESLLLLDSLKINSIITVVLTLMFFISLYYFISKRIANPYTQAIAIKEKLENEIKIRTGQLEQSNAKVRSSVLYAKRLQESILPLKQERKKVFKDSFVIWRPRDIVGGDFFWLREFDDVIVLAVGDCTGHGVPGALMTMTVNAILYDIVVAINKYNPSIILKELHTKLRQALNKDFNTGLDDGLDIAVFCIMKKSDLLYYCGADIDLYIKRGEEIKIIKSQTKGIGYDYMDVNEDLSNDIIIIEEGDTFIVSTDGFIHQNGGYKNYPFWKTRYLDLVKNSHSSNLGLMKAEFENTLDEYMGEEPQRDDITVFAFKIK